MAKKQTTTPPNEWLYKDEEEKRLFRKEVILPDTAPFWVECTNEEKEEWEREHPQPEPEEGKNE